MTHRVYKTSGRRRYAYEYESFYDRKLHRTRQRMVRYVGRCDAAGEILAPAKITVDHVHSSFEVGPSPCSTPPLKNWNSGTASRRCSASIERWPASS